MSVLFRCSLLLAFVVGIYAQDQEPPRIATTTLFHRVPNPDTATAARTGAFQFTETDNGLRITGTVAGLAAGRYVIRVHERGDITTCANAGGVFLAEGSDVETVDIPAGAGVVPPTINALSTTLRLRGANSVLGRSLVVSAQDNTRVLCGVIGILSPLTPWNSAATSAPSLLLYITAAIFAYARM